MQMWVISLDREDPLEKGMATHSSILAWKIPWTEGTVAGLQSMGSQRVGHDLVTEQQQQCSLNSHHPQWTARVFSEKYFSLSAKWLLLPPYPESNLVSTRKDWPLGKISPQSSKQIFICEFLLLALSSFNASLGSGKCRHISSANSKRVERLLCVSCLLFPGSKWGWPLNLGKRVE